MRGKSVLKSCLRLLGKSETKVGVVFGIAPGPCHEAVQHVRAGELEVPIWLFANEPPLPETVALCDRVYVNRRALFLFLEAQLRLWPFAVAIAVSTWTGEHGRWLLKLAPFFIPPFRVLLLNRWGGFFPGAPPLVILHAYRFLHGLALDVLVRAQEIAAGSVHSKYVRRTQDLAAAYWLLVSYHMWRSSPVRRVQEVSRGAWEMVSCHIWRSGPMRRAGDILFGFSIFVIAGALRRLSYPHRRWFERIHGTETLAGTETLEVSYRDSGEGTDCFVQKGHAWDGRRFAEFVQKSNARWIHWQQDPDEAPSDSADVAHLFSDPRTFAVARQSDARGWKPALFPLAPFRHLQPGSASQVLAPVAQEIVVDRNKLAALGIPQTSLTQTAWALLFWQAAAAGWRCYSVPARRQSGWQADFPQLETELFLRILGNSTMRRLGPVEPNLSRGTISFAPERQLAMRQGRMRVVVVSPFLPYPLAHGGAVRIFNLCRELAGRVDFILIALREAHEVVEYEELHRVFRQVYTVDVDEHESKDERLPKQVRATQSASLRALITDVCERLDPDLIQIEFTHMAGYRDCAPGVPALLVEHDLTFELYGQLLRTESSDAARREYRSWLDFERRWLAAYDGVWTMSREDRGIAIREGSDPERTFVVPNGVDVCRFVPVADGPFDEESRDDEPPTVLYIGSFRHLPNIRGFQKLSREVMPRVWQRIPNARLLVVAGPRYEYFWDLLAREPLVSDPRIEVRGFVEDVRPLYAQATAVAAPLEVSAGTNIKVLEAMACGKAVVVTPVGCAGLGVEDDEQVLIREDWDEFAAAVRETLLNADLRRRLGARARRTVEERFSWTAIAKCAYLSYQDLAQAHQEGLQDTAALAFSSSPSRER